MLNKSSTTMLTEQEQQWVETAACHFALSEITSVARVSGDNPLSGCSIFRITSGNQSFALKIYPRGWWADRLYRAHSTAEFLNRRGFPAPCPLRTEANDRILFLGENPAICTTWLPGRPLWDAAAEAWLPGCARSSLLHSVVKQLAVFHDMMAEYKAEPTRMREFPSVAWLSEQLEECRKSAVATACELNPFLDALSGILVHNDFPEQFVCRHTLIDCHPGQFLFDGDLFTGMVDFDHVATAPCFRDLCKLLATDCMTLSEAPALITAYLSLRELPDRQRGHLPAGILRYVIRSTVMKLHKSLSEQSYDDSIKEAFKVNLQAFVGILPVLKTALGINEMYGMPEDFTVN